MNEYLKEEIHNMKFNHKNNDISKIYKIISNNKEETKVNTLDINNYFTSALPNTYSYRNHFNEKTKIIINKKLKSKLFKKSSNKFEALKNLKKYPINRDYLNKNYEQNSIQNTDRIYNSKNVQSIQKKLSYNELYKLKNTKGKKNLKKSINKPNLIKKIEFFTFNEKNKNNSNIKDIHLSFNKMIDKNSSYKKKRFDEFNDSKKKLNISFNFNKFKKENISNNSTINKYIYKYDYYSTLNNKNNKIIASKKIKKGNNTNKNKKIKMDILKKSNFNIDDNNEKQLINLNNDVERLIKENNLIKEKTNEKFRFRFYKSSKKNIYNKININDFAKDFFIIPKEYSNYKLS